MQRKARTHGFFASDRFHKKKRDLDTTDEISLNPAFFSRSDEETLSTLAHEMVHLWQHHFRKPGRGGYHNREWAEKMLEIGLFPSSTGEEGGKTTGDHMSHYIVPGGAFQRACKKLRASGFKLVWVGLDEDALRKKPPPAGRIKFTCPGCSLNAWAKPSAKLRCGDCNRPMCAG